MSSSCRSPRRSLLSIVYSSAVIPAFTPPYLFPVNLLHSHLHLHLHLRLWQAWPHTRIEAVPARSLRFCPLVPVHFTSPCPVLPVLPAPCTSPVMCLLVTAGLSPLMSPCPLRLDLIRYVSRSVLGSVYAYCGRDEGSYTCGIFSSGARTRTRTSDPSPGFSNSDSVRWLSLSR